MSGRMQDSLSEYMHICIYRKYINIHIVFTWQIVSQMICQKLFQNRCQIEWQKICEKKMRIHARWNAIKCQIECQKFYQQGWQNIYAMYKAKCYVRNYVNIDAR